MTAPLNRIASDPLDEEEEVSEQVIRQLRQRLLLYQAVLWLVPLIAVPVAIVCLTLVLGVEPLSPSWYVLLGGLVGAIAYCGRLEAQLACKRRGKDPGRCRKKVIGSTIVFTVFHCAVITTAGAALFIAIVSHPGGC
ncbi:hypothetical protein [Haloferula sp. BvORR071]|uniref:hypothetical protein n=1 Tax=Haloferula sp. BvORR071 TaxID=1396141 RepID=UPI000555D463|nr:hypothetical protein [Haloferula sp. BvORR071]